MPAFLLTFRCGKVRGFRKNPDIGGLMADKIYDVVIVGAGTAGLSAAIYALRAGKSVLVLEEKCMEARLWSRRRLKIIRASLKYPVLNLHRVCINRQRIWEWNIRPAGY